MKIDWQTIRKPLIAFSITGIVSGLILFATIQYNSREYHLYLTIEKEFNQTRQRYEQARRDRELYKQYLDVYTGLSAKGIIGKEQRLSWIEVLQDINKRLQLSALRYEISPQQEGKLTGINLPRNIRINTSKMDLVAGVLHEGDLIDILQTLKERANGFYSLDSCEISTRLQSNRTVRYQPGASYVDINCILNWHTVEIKT